MDGAASIRAEDTKLLQDGWGALSDVVRLGWAAHCDLQLQACLEQLHVADSRGDDSAAEASPCRSAVLVTGSSPA